MSSDGPTPAIPDETVVEAVRQALEDGHRDTYGGGVPPEHVAEYCDYEASTLHTRLAEIAERGDLVRVDGADPETRIPRTSYLPPDWSE